ncbi:MAG: Zn-dependent hydrolase [Ilumatobacteraceae bacterium]
MTSGASVDRRDELRVDGQRLWRRIIELGEVGAIKGPDGAEGCARLALSDADRQGRDLVVGWMRDLGLEVAIDAIGNVIATRPGTDATATPVMTGSHIDTVATGGRFDGNLGVLAGLEVVETLEQHGVRTTHPIAVAFFTDEEGARFAPDMLGSLVYVGGMPLEEALDIGAMDDGARLGDELDRIGYLGPLPCPTATVPHAYVELHIEQGPILEDEDVTIGVVEGVQGISWTEVSIIGRSAHAGTTPIDLRRDAGYVAVQIAAYARRLAGEIGGNQVATVGRLDLRPGLVNVVAGAATLTVDMRNADDSELQRAEAAMSSEIERLAVAEGVTATTRSLARYAPVDFDPATVDLVEAMARRLGYSTRRMPSGAGHDAQMLARICPAAMIFTPSVAGLSHNIAEHTHPADVTAGADVLLQTLLSLAG